MEANREVNAKTSGMHEKYGDVFTGIGCLKGTFSLLVKEDAKPYKVSQGV